MLSIDQARTLQGKPVHGVGGAKLGSIDRLYADREDGHPTFATVHTGLLGSKTHFVPLEQAELTDDGVHVPYDRDLVSDAPSIHPDAELSPEEEERLYAHYGVTSGGAVTGTPTGTATRDVAPPATTPPAGAPTTP